MVRLKSFLRKWWWIVASCAALVAYVVMKLFLRPRNSDVVPPPEFLSKARNEIEKARLEGEIEKAKAKATADVHREQLNQIEEKAKRSPAEARKELSEWLMRNL